MTINDKAAKPFDGAATYRLNVPANPAVTLYLVGHGLRPRHARPHPQHAVVQPRLHHFRNLEERGWFRGCLLRPEVPGGQGLQLDPHRLNGKFEVLFRFYGPQKPLFEKTWKLTDIEKAAQ